MKILTKDNRGGPKGRNMVKVNIACFFFVSLDATYVSIKNMMRYTEIQKCRMTLVD